MWRRCRLDRERVRRAEQNDTRRRIARAGRCGPSKGWRRSAAEYSGFAKCTPHSGLVVHLANLLVFFLTNRGQTFSGVGTPFASLFCRKLTSLRVVFSRVMRRHETNQTSPGELDMIA